MQKLAIIVATASFLLIAPRPASAVERCYDELGVKIPGACEDQQQTKPTSSGGASEFSGGDPAHRGFFLRFNLGGGPIQVTTDDDLKVGNGGMQLTIEIGGALFDDFAVYGLLLANSIVGPTLEVDGNTLQADDNTSFGTTIVGGGVTYYLPWNIYVDAAAGVARHELRYEGPLAQWRIETDPGLGVMLGAGKEWMVSDHWGLGRGAHAVVTSRKDKDDAGKETQFASAAISFSFSASYF